MSISPDAVFTATTLQRRFFRMPLFTRLRPASPSPAAALKMFNPSLSMNTLPGSSRLMIWLETMEARESTRSAPAMCRTCTLRSRLVRVMICTSGRSLRQ